MTCIIDACNIIHLYWKQQLNVLLIITVSYLHTALKNSPICRQKMRFFLPTLRFIDPFLQTNGKKIRIIMINLIDYILMHKLIFLSNYNYILSQMYFVYTLWCLFKNNNKPYVQLSTIVSDLAQTATCDRSVSA